jgi:hypothetical protein
MRFRATFSPFLLVLLLPVACSSGSDSSGKHDTTSTSTSTTSSTSTTAKPVDPIPRDVGKAKAATDADFCAAFAVISQEGAATQPDDPASVQLHYGRIADAARSASPKAQAPLRADLDTVARLAGQAAAARRLAPFDTAEGRAVVKRLSAAATSRCTQK